MGSDDQLLNRGDFDVALNGIEIADEKRRVCELTRAYYVAAERLTVRRADERAPRSLEALRGRPAGTLPGSLAERILIRAGAEVKTYDGGQNEFRRSPNRPTAASFSTTRLPATTAQSPSLELLAARSRGALPVRKAG